MRLPENLRVGMIYGSDTGTTEQISVDVKDAWKISELEVMDASNGLSVADFEKFDVLILGLSTWYDGDLQSDFEDFYEEFVTINFENTIVAMYGLGDQHGYGEFFVDGLGILGEVILKNGGKIIGMWPTQGYEHTESKAEFTKDLFYGLALDEDNQMELTQGRLTKWIAQVEEELMECFVGTPDLKKS